MGRGSAIPACIAGGIPAYLAAGLQGGGIPACLAGFQAHTQGGSLGGSGWGISRPTPKGEIEGDLVQAHSQGEVEGELARGVPALGGACSRGCPAPWEVCLLQGAGGACSGGGGCGDHPTFPHDGYCYGCYTSYWNAFLLELVIEAILNFTITNVRPLNVRKKSI